MKLAVIIPAAGASARYTQAGGLRSKLDEDLGGKPVLQRTVELFTKFDDDAVTIAPIIVAGPHDDDAFNDFRTRHADRLAILGASICRGGRTHRWETVRAALELVPAHCTHIAVHDAARPCTGFDLLSRVFAAAREHGSAIPAIPVSDTVKRVRETDAAAAGKDPLAAIFGDDAPATRKLRTVEATIDRAGLVLAQTPQVFKADLLRRAYAQQDLTSTDDAGLVERLPAADMPVVVVDGDPRNIKITLPADVELARAIMGLRGPQERAVHKRF